MLNPRIGNTPWILSGDFNTMLGVHDRVNGAPVTMAEIKDFSEFVELKSSGHFFLGTRVVMGIKLQVILTGVLVMLSG